MKRKMSTLLAALLALTLALSACGSKEETAPAAEQAPAETEANPEEPSESAEAPQPEESTPKEADAAILAVSFGTSYNDSREKTIGAIERAMGSACPEYEVRRAFTAQIIIDKLKKRDGLAIDNVTEALDRAAADEVKTLVVQPTHLMNGLEYQDVIEELKEHEEDFERIVVGEPLLMQ